MPAVTSKDTLSEYCLRKLGAPVIEINVDEDQIDDRINETLELFQEFHSDATLKGYLKHKVTQTDLDNNYITLDKNIQVVTKLFPMSQSFNNTSNMFNIKNQMMLNDIADLQNFAGDLMYYEQIQQYLSIIDEKLNGLPQVQFSRHMNRLHIFGDLNDGDIKKDDFIIAETYTIIDPETHTSIYDNKFVKAYASALIKQQWGSNLIKFEGMQLPGGVILNGRQLYDDATTELDRLKEDMRLEHEMPPDFFMG